MVGFVIIGVLLVIAAIAVVVARQPVHSALALIGVTIGLAMIYLILSAEFLAVAQVIVYAGAIMVLFLFVVTLLTAGKEETESPDALVGQRSAGALFGLLVGGALAVVAVLHPAPKIAAPVVAGFGGLHAVGQLLWGPGFVMLAAVGLMLLTGVLGVLMLNRPEAAEKMAGGGPTLPPGVTVVRAEGEDSA